MKRLTRWLILLGILVWAAGSLHADVSPPSIRSGATNPSKCSAGVGLGQLKLFYNTTDGKWKWCSATDTWSDFVTGSGVAGQVGYFSDPNTVTSDEGFTYNPTDGLTVAGEGWSHITPSANPTGGEVVAGRYGFNNTDPTHVKFTFYDDSAWQTALTSPGSEVNYFTKSIWIDTPVVADSGRIQIMFPVAVHITRVAASTKLATSTVTFNLDQRAAATPDTAGTDVLSAGLVADTNQQTSCASGCDVNTITAGAIAANVPVAITISAIANAPTDVRIHVQGTIDHAP